jgi:hypothetical protein
LPFHGSPGTSAIISGERAAEDEVLLDLLVGHPARVRSPLDAAGHAARLARDPESA